MLTEDSLKDAVAISQFIENYKQTNSPQLAYNNYTNDIKPQISAYENKHGNSPNLLFKKQLDEINTSNTLVTNGKTGSFYGNYVVNDYAWNTLFIDGGSLKTNPQLYISANAYGIKYGIDYGNEIIDDSNIFVQQVLNDINIKNEILTILERNIGIKLYDIQSGSIGLPAIGSEIQINSIKDIENKWNYRSHLIGTIENQNINAASGQLIESNLNLLFPLYLKISSANQGVQASPNSNPGQAKPINNQDTEEVVISEKFDETAQNHNYKCDDIESKIKGKPRNKIIYGAPGTGKSYELRKQSKDLGFIEDNIIRVTFYPGYSYQQFIGTYKPTPIYKSFDDSVYGVHESYNSKKLGHPKNKEPLIDYSFVPGPFITLLVEAIKANEHKTNCNFMLIIEEINRANVASVFGDVFQLLDRDKDEQSEYYIRFNPDVEKFLKDELKNEKIDVEKIKIPKNLFIWATMNNADQGVMPLDSAFKRRWSFEYINIDKFKDKLFDDNNNPWLIKFGDKCYVWNELRTRINERLKGKVNEDKLLGPFFMSRKELLDPDSVLNKLLLYLREDVVRHQYELLFNSKFKIFSDIAKRYCVNNYANAVDVFCDFEGENFWNAVINVSCDGNDSNEEHDITDGLGENDNQKEGGVDPNTDDNEMFLQHYENASKELQDLFGNLNRKIKDLDINIKDDYIGPNIRYNLIKKKFAQIRFIEFKNRKPTYLLLILKWNNQINDSKNLSYNFNETDPQRFGIYKKVNINTEEMAIKNFSIDDIMDLVRQSYESLK